MFRLALVSGSLCVALIGCGEQAPAPKPQPSGQHVWKSQTDTLQQAKDAAAGFNQAMQSQEDAIERARRGE